MPAGCVSDGESKPTAKFWWDDYGDRIEQLEKELSIYSRFVRKLCREMGIEPPQFDE